MYTFKKTYFSLVLSLTITGLWQNSLAQRIDHYTALLPYNIASTGIGQTIGGASLAFPDSIPIIYNNPANLAQLRRITGFISLNYGRGNLKPESETDPYYKPNYRDDVLNPGIATFSLPFHLLDLPVTLAASYNGTISYSYEIGDIYTYSRKSQSASLGLAIQPSPQFRVGIGGTHRFGDYTAKTFDGIEGEFESNRTSHYSGNVYHIGFQSDIAQRFAFGAVYCFP